MIDKGKQNVLGIQINAIDYEAAVARIIQAAQQKTPMAVSALAVHGVMTGVLDPSHKYRLNQFDLLVPDGQPVRWAMNLLNHVALKHRVYGPDLTLKVCEEAAKQELSIFLYGSKPDVVELFAKNLKQRYPKLSIAGYQPSLFRQTTPEEKQEIIEGICNSGAHLTFVGLGCPRQEVWVYEYHRALSMPTLAVGAAFDFHAGTLKQAPSWMQDYGLEWLFRLYKEPRRLWRRYLLLNPQYMWNIFLQSTGLRTYDPQLCQPPEKESLYG